MVEEALRRHVAESSHPFAIALRRVGGGLFYPPRSLPPRFHGLPSPPGQCFAVAFSLAHVFGLELALGYSAPQVDERPRVHCWNLDEGGLVIDLAWQRGVSLGYVGYRPSVLECNVLARANAPEISEILGEMETFTPRRKTYEAPSAFAAASAPDL